jgi:HD-GYP domain-containing protein (c-di-GMP phosphodiesterase class II)
LTREFAGRTVESSPANMLAEPRDERFMRIQDASATQPDDDAAGVGESSYILELAISYRRTGQRGKAIRLLQGVLEGEPGCAPACALLAAVLADDGRYADAIACWEQLLELEPQNDLARRSLDELRGRSATPNGRSQPVVTGAHEDAAAVAPPRPPAEAAVPATEPGAASAGTVTPLALGLADVLVGMLEFQDPYFRGSASQVRLVAGALARELGLDEHAVREIELAALLRDLGQLPVRGAISQVGSALSQEAKRDLQQHVHVAIDLLGSVDLPVRVQEAIRHHHERWDGSGYTGAMRGEEIPLSARILAVADTFAAMIAARPHRLPQRPASVLHDMQEWSGTRYDPRVIDALVRVLDRPRWQGPGFGLRQHLIVVDADEARALVTTLGLCAAGYLAEAAFSVDSALQRAARSRLSGPAACIIAADLPADGTADLLRRLRSTPRAAAAGVVVTGAAAGQRVALLRAGADACLPADATLDELGATVEVLLRRSAGADHSARSQPENLWAGLQGDLQEFPLGWLLQVLHYDGRTAGVYIVGHDDEGVIYLQQGKPRFAQTRSLTGEEAFRAMIRWRAGSFTVDPDACIDQQHTIVAPLINLLLEQAVADDHSALELRPPTT